VLFLFDGYTRVMTSAKPEHYKHVYRKFQAPISTVYDCGKKCAPLNNGEPVCCSTTHAIPIVDKAEWQLLKTRTDMWTRFKPKTPDQIAEVNDLKGSDSCAVVCKGAAHCERDNRSLACRSFPFFPYYDKSGEDAKIVGLATYWSFTGWCWVISNITIVEAPFAREMIETHEYLFARDEHWRRTYIEQSATTRGVYSRWNKKFPIIDRNGDFFWVLPHSGGKMVPAKKKELLELRKGFTGKPPQE